MAQNLSRLHRILLDRNETWSSDTSFIGTYAYLPKSIDISAWNNENSGHFNSLDPIANWKRRFEESGRRADATLRLIIRPSVDFQVVSALWIIKVGHLFDGALDPHLSYANRLRRTRAASSDESRRGNINLSATGLFVPYFSAYREWKEKGLSAMEAALSGGKSILAITMDIEQFYHRVCPRFPGAGGVRHPDVTNAFRIEHPRDGPARRCRDQVRRIRSLHHLVDREGGRVCPGLLSPRAG